MSTETVLRHHLEAFGKDVDEIMRDYTPDSVLFTPDGPFRGLEPIRVFFDAFLRSSPPELIRALTLIRSDIHGEMAYILWNAPPFIPMATDTFVVRDGKIIAQSFALFLESRVEAPVPSLGAASRGSAVATGS